MQGIAGHETFHDDLLLMYCVSISQDNGTLRSLELVPFRIHKFRLQAAARHEADWLAATLSRQGRCFGTQVAVTPDIKLRLDWT